MTRKPHTLQILISYLDGLLMRWYNVALVFVAASCLTIFEIRYLNNVDQPPTHWAAHATFEPPIPGFANSFCIPDVSASPRKIEWEAAVDFKSGPIAVANGTDSTHEVLVVSDAFVGGRGLGTNYGLDGTVFTCEWYLAVGVPWPNAVHVLGAVLRAYPNAECQTDLLMLITILECGRRNDPFDRTAE